MCWLQHIYCYVSKDCQAPHPSRTRVSRPKVSSSPVSTYARILHLWPGLRKYPSCLVIYFTKSYHYPDIDSADSFASAVSSTRTLSAKDYQNPVAGHYTILYVGYSLYKMGIVPLCDLTLYPCAGRNGESKIHEAPELQAGAVYQDDRHLDERLFRRWRGIRAQDLLVGLYNL